MTDDQPFRLFLLIAIAILLPIGIHHRLKSRTGEKLDRFQEGLFILITLRLIGIIGWVVVFAYLINPACLAWATFQLPLWLRWLGAALLILGVILFTWTLCTLGRNLTDTVVTRKKHTLITTGPYHWVRHPFYTTALLTGIAVSLVAANWLLFVIGCLAFLLWAVRSRKEEENLITRFGDDYQNYMKRTGRFLPRP
jgi:protein-S-isoprenylcysteine O-methyltransferase Ste14